jgi:hypothetical protein
MATRNATLPQKAGRSTSGRYVVPASVVGTSKERISAPALSSAAVTLVLAGTGGAAAEASK